MSIKSWNSFKNVLCIRLDNLGDVLMTSPALRALKETVPGRKITLLTSSAGNLISPYIPEIDETIVFDTPWTKNNGKASGESVGLLIERLKVLEFDAAIIFNVYSQNPLPAAMICFQAGISTVAGYCRENPYQLISDWIPDKEPLFQIRHEVLRQIDLVRHLGSDTKNLDISLKVSANAKLNTRSLLEKSGINPDEKYIVLHPGVSEAKRQYPVQLFADTAARIVRETGYQVLVTGVLSEKILADQICKVAGNDAFNLAGRLDMEELIALIRDSELVISNNTGPVHIASGVQTPVVVLYALTNPQHTPWNVRHKVLPFDVPEELRSKNTIISYANSRCFADNCIMPMPEEIVQAVNELLTGKTEVERTMVLSV